MRWGQEANALRGGLKVKNKNIIKRHATYVYVIKFLLSGK